MPFMQAFVERLNTRFNSTNIGNVDETKLAPGQNVAAAAAGSTRGSGAIHATPDEQAYIGNFPAQELEALRDILHWAVTQKTRVPVQFLWVPDAAYHIEYSSVAGIDAGPHPSGPGISVLIKGPSPAAVLKHYP